MHPIQCDQNLKNVKMNKVQGEKAKLNKGENTCD
jgi:hypothetical protein